MAVMRQQMLRLMFEGGHGGLQQVSTREDRGPDVSLVVDRMALAGSGCMHGSRQNHVADVQSTVFLW